MDRNWRWLCRALVLTSAVASLGGSTLLPGAAAQETLADIQFAVSPAGEPDLSPFRLEVDAGASLDTTLVIANDGDNSVELTSYPVDVVTAINGGYQVVPLDSAMARTAAWISLSGEPYLVDPSEVRAVKIQVSVPTGTPPGEYMAALATETVAASAVEGSDAFRQRTRKVNAVSITVPGPETAGFELGAPVMSFVEGGTQITMPISNTGNMRVRPSGVLTVANDVGELVARVPVILSSVYAWDSTVIQYVLAADLATGEYVISVELRDEATGTEATQSGTASLLAMTGPATPET